jgi:hypothetical protein
MTTALAVSNGTTDDSYLAISFLENEATFRSSSSTLSNPETLRIAHTPAKDDDGVDRHLVSFGMVVDDSDGVPRTGTVHAVIAFPRKGIAQADIDLLYTRLKDVLDTHMATITGGFVPTD